MEGKGLRQPSSSWPRSYLLQRQSLQPHYKVVMEILMPWW